jgi:hypothetical protein
MCLIKLKLVIIDYFNTALGVYYLYSHGADSLAPSELFKRIF